MPALRGVAGFIRLAGAASISSYAYVPVALYAANAIISVKNARSGISASDSVAVRYRPRSYRHALRQRRADPTHAQSRDKADRKADRDQVTRKIREVSPREIVNQCVGEAELSRI